MATTQAPPKIDIHACRAYLERLQTSEYVTQIKLGEINPSDERPDFDEAIKPLVLHAEKQARQSGNIHVVINAIDEIRRTPIGRHIFASAELKQEQRAKVADVKDSKQIMPPLPEGVELPSVAYPLRDAYVQYSRAVSPEGYE